ncbi:MAG: hypothetical protein PHU06_03120 [Gallionella sp.]|nr:hypothetical protein [Gallionella sp.]MDD4958245.1 hypothetical protein [Gallionella sp.]
MQPLLGIALVMFCAGALGGIVNFFLADSAEQEKPLPWWQHVLVGVVASFMVPLFLNMISGDLIDKIQGIDGKAADYSKMFVLAGFCLVAAVSSRAFIRTLSDKVLQEVRKKVEAVDKKVDEAVVKSDAAEEKASAASADASEARQAVSPLVEDDPVEESSGEARVREIASARIEITPTEASVLKVMADSSFALRSITGTAKDAGLDKATTSATISSLLSKELIGETIGKSGQPRWFLTKAGRLRQSDG